MLSRKQNSTQHESVIGDLTYFSITSNTQNMPLLTSTFSSSVTIKKTNVPLNVFANPIEQMLYEISLVYKLPLELVVLNFLSCVSGLVGRTRMIFSQNKQIVWGNLWSVAICAENMDNPLASKGFCDSIRMRLAMNANSKAESFLWNTSSLETVRQQLEQNNNGLFWFCDDVEGLLRNDFGSSEAQRFVQQYVPRMGQISMNRQAPYVSLFGTLPLSRVQSVLGSSSKEDVVQSIYFVLANSVPLYFLPQTELSSTSQEVLMQLIDRLAALSLWKENPLFLVLSDDATQYMRRLFVNPYEFSSLENTTLKFTILLHCLHTVASNTRIEAKTVEQAYTLATWLHAQQAMVYGLALNNNSVSVSQPRRRQLALPNPKPRKGTELVYVVAKAIVRYAQEKQYYGNFYIPNNTLVRFVREMHSFEDGATTKLIGNHIAAATKALGIGRSKKRMTDGTLDGYDQRIQMYMRFIDADIFAKLQKLADDTHV